MTPGGRGFLSKETLTRRGEDMLPALHFYLQVDLVIRWMVPGTREECTNINTPQYNICTLGDTAATHTHTYIHTCCHPQYTWCPMFRYRIPSLCILLCSQPDIEVNRRRVPTCSSALHVRNSYNCSPFVTRPHRYAPITNRSALPALRYDHSHRIQHQQPISF